MTLELDVSTLDEKPMPKGKLTYEEFLEWADEDTYAEWVDGEIEWMSPCSARHQDIGDFLTALMRIYTEDHDAGRIISSPFQMKLSQVRRGREPDVIFIAKGNLHRLQTNYLDGPGDLVVEIVSPESVERDRVRKYQEYEASGVREYWLVDPTTDDVEFYALGGDGRFAARQPNADGVYESVALPGFWINVGWLWQSPLPTLRSILSQWEENTP